MFIVHLGLVGAILAVIMLPRIFAAQFDNNTQVSNEEYDYR